MKTQEALDGLDENWTAVLEWTVSLRVEDGAMSARMTSRHKFDGAKKATEVLNAVNRCILDHVTEESVIEMATGKAYDNYC